MKTQNNNQETVLSRVNKNVLYTSAIIVTIVLFSISASAQKFWKQFSSTDAYGKMTSLMVGQRSETEKTDAVFEIINAEVSSILNPSNESFNFENETEETSEVESWMTDESFFTANNFNSLETEKNLEIEDWMIDNSNFGSPMISVSEETENPLEIESWMIDDSLFSENSAVIAEEKDEALNVEKWMMSESNFYSPTAVYASNLEPALGVEGWMTDENFFKTAELLTANGSDQEIEKYTQKQIRLQTTSARE